MWIIVRNGGARVLSRHGVTPKSHPPWKATTPERRGPWTQGRHRPLGDVGSMETLRVGRADRIAPPIPERCCGMSAVVPCVKREKIPLAARFFPVLPRSARMGLEPPNP